MALVNIELNYIPHLVSNCVHDEVELPSQLVQVECDPFPVEVVHPAVADAQVGVVLNVRVDQRGSPEIDD